MTEFFRELYIFLNTNLFQTLITLVVGSVAIYIYRRQKNDFKKDTANSILLEIQNAERAITKVREKIALNTLDIDVSVLQYNSWSQYKYLFSRVFDRDEWDMIENFYNKASLLDKAITSNNTAFVNDVEQIRANKQRILADCVKEILDQSKPDEKPEELIKKFNDKTKAFDDIYMSKQGEFAYRPQKTINDAKIYLTDLPSITTSSAGEKLKKLAGVYKK